MFVFITEYSQSIPQYLIILLIHYLIPRTYFCSYLLVCFNNHIMGIKSESPFYLGTTSQALKIDDRLTGCQLSSSVDELFSVTHSKEILFSKDTSYTQNHLPFYYFIYRSLDFDPPPLSGGLSTRHHLCKN